MGGLDRRCGKGGSDGLSQFYLPQATRPLPRPVAGGLSGQRLFCARTKLVYPPLEKVPHRIGKAFVEAPLRALLQLQLAECSYLLCDMSQGK